MLFFYRLIQCLVLLQPPTSPFFSRYFSHSISGSPQNLSPTPDRCSDRFIPSRAGARWHIDFNLVCGGKSVEKTPKKVDVNINNHINHNNSADRNQSHQSTTTNENNRGRLCNFIVDCNWQYHIFCGV